MIPVCKYALNIQSAISRDIEGWGYVTVAAGEQKGFFLLLVSMFSIVNKLKINTGKKLLLSVNNFYVYHKCMKYILYDILYI